MKWTLKSRKKTPANPFRGEAGAIYAIIFLGGKRVQRKLLAQPGAHK